jgi:hypothetical protein
MTVLSLLLSVVLLASNAPAASSQAIAEASLKAAFLYNFVKFTEWPTDAVGEGAPIVLCVADSGVADALDQTIPGRAVDGHPLSVNRLKPEASPRGCAVLYVGGGNEKRRGALLAGVRGQSVLSVSDAPGFIAQGGVAYFFIEDSKMRFAINPDAAERVHLRLSSKLLSLAKLVKDDSHGSDD